MSVETVPARAAAQPKRVASFPCWQFIMIQVIGPQTIFIAEDADELKIVSDSGAVLNDGLQINQATGIFEAWWVGELYAAGSVAGAQFILQTPGSKSSLGPGQGKAAGGGSIV